MAKHKAKKRSAEPVANESYRVFYDYIYEKVLGTASEKVVLSYSRDFDEVSNDRAIGKAKRHIASKNRRAPKGVRYELRGVSQLNQVSIYQATKRELRFRSIQVGD